MLNMALSPLLRRFTFLTVYAMVAVCVLYGTTILSDFAREGKTILV